MPDGRVGNAAARAIQGRSAGADVVVLTPDATVAPELAEALLTLTPNGRLIGTPSLAEAAAIAAEARPEARSEARAEPRALIVVDGAVRLELPALLDLLDRPDPASVALVVDPGNPEAPRQVFSGLGWASLLRVGRDDRLVESVGSGVHRVGEPNRLSGGVLRVAANDRRRAAQIWTGVAHRADLADADRFDLALVSLVRAGVPVQARPLGFYRWSRGAEPQVAAQSGVRGSGWQQRLRTASRGGDGLYSSVVVRRLSRRGTAVGLRLGWTPNAVTLASLLIGLGAAALVWTGLPWAWITAAVLLQLALVVDCMDGEIARFTRRFSSLGGWLDGVGDRIKEYAIFAAAAAVAVREGQSNGWLLAVIAMVLVTGRHLEDYSYTDKLAPSRQSRPELIDIADPADRRAGSGARTMLRTAPTGRQRSTFWAKKVVHLPIAERYLLLSILLLTQRPVWVLVVSIAANAAALVWTLGGRIVRELRAPADSARAGNLTMPFDGLRARGPAGQPARPRPFDGLRAREPGGQAARPARAGIEAVPFDGLRARGPDEHNAFATRAEPVEAQPAVGPLDVQLDLGPLARLVGRLPNRSVLRGPFYPGVVALVAVWLGLIACLCAGYGGLALVGGLLSALLVAVTFRAPVRHRFGWLLPPLLWAAEAAIAAALLAHGPVGAALFAFLAACAYRRYDLIYSVRLNGMPPERDRPGWTIGLGVEGRIIGVAVLLIVVLGLRAAPEGLTVGLLIGVVVVAVPALVASVREWRPRRAG